MWHTYILLCRDGSLYTGITNDLKKRLREHKKGKGARYTRSHKALRILHTESFRTRSRALVREAEIKSWKREKKLQLIHK